MSVTNDRRQGMRCPVRVPTVYWGDEFLGEGTVIDLAPHSLLLVGNYLPAKGTRLRLMVYLPDDPKPIYVTRAMVRSVRRIELGVELLTLPEQDWVRLDAFCSTLFPKHSRSLSSKKPANKP